MAETGRFDRVYNPDVLSCLANLSNDEVFTPPEIANVMLDMLPQELFRNPDATFLDPACKSGIFLREIAKRLIVGLAPRFPDLQNRLDHIFHKQLFGIAITELTSMLSRRSLYCSKNPSSGFSVSRFGDAQGNVRFKRIRHTWQNGKCVYCGAAQSQYGRKEDLETYAYEWIHAPSTEEIFKMRFDVIISNPPYHLSDGGNGASAKPIYQEFVERARKLRPNYLTMIIPSRWFNGGKGLDQFRSGMLADRHITRLVDYQNAKDCFPGVSLGGGVCYFLWEKNREADCVITNVLSGREITLERPLDQFPVFVRYNDSIGIIQKVQAKAEKSIVGFLTSRNPFGLPTNARGSESRREKDITLFSSQGVSYVSREEIPQGAAYIDQYKVMISRVTSEHAGEPDKSGMYKVISKIRLLAPGEVCTDSYILGYPTGSRDEAENFLGYLKTKFVRFLLLQALSSINLTREAYTFVPEQDFTKPWTDNGLYAKYGLSAGEISFIEAMIKPMEGGDGAWPR